MDEWVKSRADAPLGAFVAEAAGLDWIRVPGGPRVPLVLDVTAEALTLERVTPGAPTADVADDFGHRLATLHQTGADAFGAPWTGYVGPVADLLPLDNADSPTWAEHFAERRVGPALREARDRGRLDERDATAVAVLLERLSALVPTEPVARLHGDLWTGNVLWSPGRVWLIDPAAHGGHRETDLAMLSLFGLPFLDRVLASYDECWPLQDGWRERLPLHQLWPLLVHAALFGGDYGRRAGDVARAFV